MSKLISLHFLFLGLAAIAVGVYVIADLYSLRSGAAHIILGIASIAVSYVNYNADSTDNE